jgi:hypothetical protein
MARNDVAPTACSSAMIGAISLQSLPRPRCRADEPPALGSFAPYWRHALKLGCTQIGCLLLLRQQVSATKSLIYLRS